MEFYSLLWHTPFPSPWILATAIKMAPHIHAYRAGLAAMVGLGAKFTYNLHRKIAQTGAAYGDTEETNGIPSTLECCPTRRNTNGSMSSKSIIWFIPRAVEEDWGDKKWGLVMELLVQSCLACSCCKNMCKIGHTYQLQRKSFSMEPASSAKNTITWQKVMFWHLDWMTTFLLLSKLDSMQTPTMITLDAKPTTLQLL